MKLPTHVMPIGVAAATASMTPQGLRAYDRELQPIRGPNGYRLYDPEIVARWAKQRAARRRAR